MGNVTSHRRVPNMAVVGACGAHGAALIEAFRAIGVAVTHVVDVSANVQEVAEQYGATALSDHRRLIGAPVDGVAVALPPALHAPVCLDLLRAGMAVFCEKPLAPSGPLAQAFLDEAAGLPGRLMAGFVMRHQAEVKLVAEQLRQGRLGRVWAVRARKCWSSRTPWRLEEGGGAIFVKDLHYYDLVPWLLNSRPTSVYAVGGNRFYDGAAEDAYQLLMRFADGSVFHLDSAWWPLSSRANELEVVGDRARIVVEPGRLTLYNGGIEHIAVDGEDMLRVELRAFLNFVAGDSDAAVSLPDVARAHWLAEAVRRSLQSGTEVALDEAGRPLEVRR